MALSTQWSTRPIAAGLEKDDIHIWRAFLDDEYARPERLEAVLSTDELARASRFVFPRDRNHFVSCRGILRSILAQYLGRPAGTIEFTYQPAGKPGLRKRAGDRSISFNLSHSSGLAVYAFSLDREVGIDVEAVRPNVPGEELAARFFSASELAEIRRLPAERRNEAFFACWARKEAYVKARGAGLGMPLDSFSVPPAHGSVEELTASDGRYWMVRSFHPEDGYVAAVAAEGTGLKLHLWDWMACENW